MDGFAAGGWLPAGVGSARNDSTSPELVLTHEQWQAIVQGGALACPDIEPDEEE